MVFSGLTFLYLFLPVSIILYYSVPSKNWRNNVLILLSLFFYAWGEPLWVILLIFSSVVDYVHGMVIENHRDNNKLCRLMVLSSVIINLGLLFVFKYSGFFVDTLNAIGHFNIARPEIGLPIGISFYTFQTISYTIDVYREDVHAQKNFGKFLLYVSLFPQLVAGPIVRYANIAEEIDNRVPDVNDISAGINRFMVGLTKKVIFANSCGKLATPMLTAPASELSPGMAWFGLIAYSMQYYFDFSGYSDMAIGLGRMFGFHYLENFNYPFISQSVSEYWRRWHISLGSWFRDYLFYPIMMSKGFRKLTRACKTKLGKKAAKNIPTALALFVVWGATGLWHGANWNYVLWGLYFGVFLILENLFLGQALKKLPRILRHLYLIIAVCVGFGFFYFEDLSALGPYLGALIGIGGGKADFSFGILLRSNVFIIILSVLLCTPIVPFLKKKLIERFPKSEGVISYLNVPINVALLLLCTSFLVGQTYNPFMYFRF